MWWRVHWARGRTRHGERCGDLLRHADRSPSDASPSICSQSASALTYDELQGLTYLQVKGTGVANTCPVIEGGSTNLGVR